MSNFAIHMFMCYKQMEDYIDDIEFCIGGTSMAIASIHGFTNLCLNTEFKDLSIIQYFLNHLTESGIDITIDTNYREGYDELL